MKRPIPRLVFWVAVFLCGSLQAQLLQNGDFETISVLEDQTALPNWSIDAVGGEYVSDAHSGKGAIMLKNWYIWARGWACYGGGEVTNCSGMPVSEPPSRLTGWYKYVYGENGGANDSAVCTITVLNQPDDLGNRDTASTVRALFGPSEEFQRFSIDIPYQESPEHVGSVVILFLSSEHGNCGTGHRSECLYLTLDDLELEPLK